MSETNMEARVPKRILNTLMNSVSAGVVPRSGAPYIAIGRADEINALLSDVETVGEGGGAIRFVIGKYGSGKSFLIQLIRGYALERGYLCADADLAPERKLCGSNDSGRATYRELIKNLSSKTMPDGGALPQIIARWFTSLQTELAASGMDVSSAAFSQELDKRIYATIAEFESMVGGFDFASVLSTYRRACVSGDEEIKSACLRWLRGEYTTRTAAKKVLNVSDIINDENWYDYVKLLAMFAVKTGSKGLIVFIDECVNLYKITNRISRESNYEKLLSMFNDAMQGRAPYLGMVFGGTPQFLEDPRRGMFSYEALRSRLADNRFSDSGFKNLIGPVIRLRRLSDDELYALIARVTKLHAQNYSWEPRITPEEMADFLRMCLSRAGADALITPREIIRDYVSVLNILMQNESATYAAVVGSGVVTLEHGDVAESGGEVRTESARPAEESRPASDFNPEDIEI